MLEFICGPKGTGKTKKIIDQANESSKDSISVFITDTDKYMYEIKREVRFVNVSDVDLSTEVAFIAYIRGLLDANYDIKHIFIDGAHRILNKDYREMVDFYRRLKDIANKTNTSFVLTVTTKEKGESPKL